MYYRTPLPLGEVEPIQVAPPPWWREVLVTATGIVIGTYLVEALRVKQKAKR